MLPGAFTPTRWPLSCARVVILEFGMVKIVCAPCCMIEPSATTSIGCVVDRRLVDVRDVVTAGDVELGP